MYLTALIKITVKTFRRIPSVLVCAVPLLGFVHQAKAQSVLDGLIEEGLKNNLVLQQRTISIEQAESALKLARNQFLPSVQLMGDYTSGNGGRAIAIPVGDLLNPVYQSLNQLTQSDRFPQIQNVSENFFPKNFYDAKVRTSVALVNTDLLMNRTIKGQQVALMEYEARLYRRQLVFDITQAYYNYLSAVQAATIYQGALEIVKRNLEVNESLKRNGKGLPAQVLRSKGEVENVRADLLNAETQVLRSRRYVNFLLNRPLDTPIAAEFNFQYESPVEVPAAATQREELSMLAIQQEISASVLRMNQLRRLPRLNAFLDLGSQARDWRFDSQSQYYLLGVQLSVPLFQGFATQLSIRQSRMDSRKSELALENTRAAVAMGVENAKSEWQSADRSYLSSVEQLKAAESYFRLVEKGYSEGINTLIEFLDARNQLTSAQLMTNVRAFALLTAKAKLERETASINIQ